MGFCTCGKEEGGSGDKQLFRSSMDKVTYNDNAIFPRFRDKAISKTYMYAIPSILSCPHVAREINLVLEQGYRIV